MTAPPKSSAFRMRPIHLYSSWRASALIYLLASSWPPPAASTLIEHAVQRARLRMRERDALVTNQTIGHASLDSFYGGILAQAPFECPSDLVKTSSAEGGKWLCGLSHLGRHRPCVVYSLGSSFDSSFEEAVQARVNAQAPSRAPAGCETHIYDPTLRRDKHHLVEFKAKLQEQHIGELHEVAFAGGQGVTNVTLTMMLSGTSRGIRTPFPRRTCTACSPQTAIIAWTY